MWRGVCIVAAFAAVSCVSRGFVSSRRAVPLAREACSERERDQESDRESRRNRKRRSPKHSLSQVPRSTSQKNSDADKPRTNLHKPKVLLLLSRVVDRLRVAKACRHTRTARAHNQPFSWSYIPHVQANSTVDRGEAAPRAACLEARLQHLLQARAALHGDLHGRRRHRRRRIRQNHRHALGHEQQGRKSTITHEISRPCRAQCPLALSSTLPAATRVDPFEPCALCLVCLLARARATSSSPACCVLRRSLSLSDTFSHAPPPTRAETMEGSQARPRRAGGRMTRGVASVS